MPAEFPRCSIWQCDKAGETARQCQPSLQGKLEEAVAAYRAALEEWTREAAPHWYDIAQQNMARCLALLGKRFPLRSESYGWP
jgi:hypothetical protein